ncbi:hypothetical protein J8I26_06560 [Herbaspirillum sp. LeCh32-8]|uniref:hypothetical protein n=1 Tax=Herbaspirillum sp. LeCh32-8 TaxID=2821356 RepID=UPI001AEB2818|nr:hypothetical protein [Herbaspirillum sp. LeCh32-8]MBP0597755.1 hypothetical protein [Herbaspirillum sp. LeCh32-8]
MDIEQLKLLAAHVRGLLEQRNHTIGHNKSLDLIAALPGLRNWPEVLAFPPQVARCELDQASAGRLAFRLQKLFNVEYSAQEMLAQLAASGTPVAAYAPHIWPAGPAAGVYITTSSKAIEALLESYEDATDGALVYAERAGAHRNSIDLGDGGLWSSGLDRVPTGTLIVIGPLELNQQSWKSSSERLEMACLRAANYGHRIAVLCETPAHDTLPQDICLMVSAQQDGHELAKETLRGVVTEKGELEARSDFFASWPAPRPSKPSLAHAKAPANLLSYLSTALKPRKSGYIALGSAKIEEFAAMDLAADVLGLTEHVGPAARILPRNRSTPSKDWDVPEAIRALPYLPSLQSAYAQGYRRMIFNPVYADDDEIMEISSDAMLISTTFGTTDVSEIYWRAMRFPSKIDGNEVIDRVIALATTIEITGRQGNFTVSDLFIKSSDTASAVQRDEEIDEFLISNRVIDWETEVSELLDMKRITGAALCRAFPRNKQPTDFLAKRKQSKGRPSD